MTILRTKFWIIDALLLPSYAVEKVDCRYYVTSDVFIYRRTPCKSPFITKLSGI